MPDETVVAKLKKSAANEVWVLLNTFQGQRLCHIREYFRAGDKAGWLPTRKGMSIPTHLLHKAVDAAEELAKHTAVCEVAEIPRGDKAKACFAIREYKGHVYGDIRMYYKEEIDKDWKPGKGVTLPLERLGPLVDALRLAEETASGGKP